VVAKSAEPLTAAAAAAAAGVQDSGAPWPGRLLQQQEICNRHLLLPLQERLLLLLLLLRWRRHHIQIFQSLVQCPLDVPHCHAGTWQLPLLQAGLVIA